MPSAKTCPLSPSTGAASAMPAPITCSRRDLGARERAGDQLLGEVHRLVRGVVDVDRGELVAEQLAGEVADRDAQVLVAHVDADRERRARDERHQHRWAAAALARRVVLELLDDPGPLELLHERRDRRAREAGDLGDRGAARARMPVERLDHAQPIHLARVEQACVLTGHGALSLRSGNRTPVVGLAASVPGRDLASARSDAQAPSPRLRRRPRRYVVLCGDHAAAARPDGGVRAVQDRRGHPRRGVPVGTFVGGLPGGILAARVGVRPTVLLGLALMVLSSVAVAFAARSWCSTSPDSSRASAVPPPGRVRWPGWPARRRARSAGS